MTVLQAILALLGLTGLAVFLCAFSETWRDIFGFAAIVAFGLGVIYFGAWCVMLAMESVRALLRAVGWVA